ncbi:hypothetical protein J4Q44_G00389610 [Coregonus suidteri]|uniref:Small ribosomal subunit protein mS29 n=1 Tax=Coregonus suidteri TaxID=861788 RepID=A0AAN8KKF2_9TELE
MINNDWCGGEVIAILSQTGSLYTPNSAYLPQELLGEEGFDSMDPFVPVPVSNYSEKEFESCYLYYLDSHWLQHPHKTILYWRDCVPSCNIIHGSTPSHSHTPIIMDNS